jgi:hypothetical protein
MKKATKVVAKRRWKEKLHINGFFSTLAYYFSSLKP